AYRVSAVNSSQVESTRSDGAIFFAVPRRRRPGQPALIARASASPAGVRLIALPGPGAPPAGDLLPRPRGPALAGAPGTLRPAGHGPRGAGAGAPGARRPPPGPGGRPPAERRRGGGALPPSPPPRPRAGRTPPGQRRARGASGAAGRPARAAPAERAAVPRGY